MQEPCEGARSDGEVCKLTITAKGHQWRSLAKRWRLPLKKQVVAAEVAEKLGITDAEFIRLSIIWLHLGIRNYVIKSVVNCKVIIGDQAARQWSRENHGRPPSEQMTNLKKSMQNAQQLLDYLDDIRQQQHHVEACWPAPHLPSGLRYRIEEARRMGWMSWAWKDEYQDERKGVTIT